MVPIDLIIVFAVRQFQILSFFRDRKISVAFEKRNQRFGIVSLKIDMDASLIHRLHPQNSKIPHFFCFKKESLLFQILKKVRRFLPDSANSGLDELLDIEDENRRPPDLHFDRSRGENAEFARDRVGNQFGPTS